MHPDLASGGRVNRRRLSYLPGLDGLRALAVLAVFLYHAEPGWLPGGFLGVEIFFVISGYLITGLLLSEWRQRGRIDLGGFWLRRARRLLPALFLVLLVLVVAISVFVPDEVTRLRGDTLAALGYVTNWYLVFGHQSYFVAMGRPSFLQHLWSLAVEEQFYLAWPLLFIAIMRWCPRLATPVILTGAAASAAAMALLYRPGVDPSRIYYGTDTRAAGLLIGAALATVWATRPVPAAPARGRIALLDIAGGIALIALCVLCVRVNEYQSFLYRGGFVLISLVTAVVIAAVANHGSLLGSRLLGAAPLRWLGLRSYGIYLWHWPVLMLTRARVDVPLDGLPLLALRLALTVALAEASYRFLEVPVRSGVLGRAWHAVRTVSGPGGEQAHLRWVAACGVFLGFFAVTGVDVVMARPPSTPSYLAVSSIRSGPAASRQQSNPRPLAQAEAAGAPDTQESVLPVPILPAHVSRTSAVGDSVMLGSSQALQELMPGLDIDAKVGRQPLAAITTAHDLLDAGQLGDSVVVHVGNNGPFSTKELDDLLQALGDDRRVFLVNLRVPRPWEGPNNEVIANGVARHRNTVLVDWHAASYGHPEYFRDDGVHLLPAGARIYTTMIALGMDIEDLSAMLAGR